jgi:hypothetical protein
LAVGDSPQRVAGELQSEHFEQEIVTVIGVQRKFYNKNLGPIAEIGFIYSIFAPHH